MKKQFLLNINNGSPFEGWSSYKMQKKWVLHVSPDLIYETVDVLNETAIIIGVPTKTIDIDESPANGLSKIQKKEEIFEVVADWGGRWAVFFQDLILSDVGALRGIFFDKTSASSHPALIAEPVLGEEIISKDYYFNWFLAPGTRFNNVKKLLVHQYLLMKDEFIEPVFKQALPAITYSDYEYIYELLSTRLENEISYLGKKFNIIVALSGGFDSRLIYSIAKKMNGNKVNTYTHVFPSMKNSDREVPSQINKNNRFIHPKKFDEEKLKLFDYYCGYHVKDMDRDFYSRGQWNEFSKNDVCLRGGILELAGISPAHLRSRIQTFVSPDIDFKSVLFSLNDFREFQIESLKEYFQFYYTNKIDVNYLKRFYLEQRVGGWLSYIESGLDLIDANSINIGNCSKTISLMLSIPSQMMEIKGFHLDYMYKNNSEVLKIPLNRSTPRDKIKYFTKKSLRLFPNKYF